MQRQFRSDAEVSSQHLSRNALKYEQRCVFLVARHSEAEVVKLTKPSLPSSVEYFTRSNLSALRAEKRTCTLSLVALFFRGTVLEDPVVVAVVASASERFQTLAEPEEDHVALVGR